MPEAPLHVHHQCDEAWYVLEGELKVRMGDEIVAVPAGRMAYVKRGTPHTFWNEGPSRARYLLIMTPLTKRLIDAIHQSEDRSSQAMKALFAAHSATLLV